MAQSSFERDLDRNPANFQPLTPLNFLERAAEVFPDRLAIVHGAFRCTYREFHVRLKKLASALAKRGFVRGDTVAAMLANTPAMLECHYGVPMCGAVPKALNTRLDAAALPFMLDHGEAKAIVVDREYSGVVAEALKFASVRPLVIDYDDPEYDGPGERIGEIEYQAFVADGEAKDIIISGGENISSIEVEDALFDHPGVQLAGVVARPDDKWGETPCAFVEMKPGHSATEEELIAWRRERLARYNRPRTIVFAEIPKTSTGKVQKFALGECAKQLGRESA